MILRVGRRPFTAAVASIICRAVDVRWSSGAVEGAVNRIKTLKRQMYGRANPDLLHCGIAGGEWYDELVYALLADEWAQRR